MDQVAISTNEYIKAIFDGNEFAKMLAEKKIDDDINHTRDRLEVLIEIQKAIREA